MIASSDRLDLSLTKEKGNAASKVKTDQVKRVSHQHQQTIHQGFTYCAIGIQ